jgi:hypothetical protein
MGPTVEASTALQGTQFPEWLESEGLSFCLISSSAHSVAGGCQEKSARVSRKCREISLVRSREGVL